VFFFDCRVLSEKNYTIRFERERERERESVCVCVLGGCKDCLVRIFLRS